MMGPIKKISLVIKRGLSRLLHRNVSESMNADDSAERSEGPDVAASPPAALEELEGVRVGECESSVDVQKAKDVPSPVLPSRIRLSPNLTLGKEPCYIEYFLSGDIQLDQEEYESDTWQARRIEKGIRIDPKAAGELDIPIYYNNGTCVHFELTVNPDIDSLWQKNEPGPDLIVFDQDLIRLKTGHKNILARDFQDFQLIGASRRGRSHEHAGSFRDDELGCWVDEATGRYAFFVADGAGSARFAREGARIAIRYLEDKIGSNITEALWNEDDNGPPPGGGVGKMLVALAYHAMCQIDAFIKESNNEDPNRKWSLKDFNTTLLIAAMKRDKDGAARVVSFSIGDGAIVGYTGDRVEIMTAPDIGEFCGGTRFLTMPSVWKKASEDWTAFYRTRVFSAHFTPAEAKRLWLLLMTDGVSDPWFETEAGLANLERWRNFVDLELLGRGDGQAGIDSSGTAETNAERLWRWLGFSRATHYDDRTLIAAYPSGEGASADESIVRHDESNIRTGGDDL